MEIVQRIEAEKIYHGLHYGDPHMIVVARTKIGPKYRIYRKV